jgi:hypothetical protein
MWTALTCTADAENGSGGHMSDLEFDGGKVGICKTQPRGQEL